jgi:ribonuclease BN (tRNA processing enzyme)
LIEAEGVRLLLDCGSGAVHRMENLGIDWSSITHVAITHFHADHIADIPMLLMAWRWGQLPPRSEPATLYGPPGIGALFEKMAAVYGNWMLAPGFPFTVREIAPDEVIRLGKSLRLTHHAVPHTAESVAYCINEDGRRLVYTGDTGLDDSLGAWIDAGNCDVLLSECSLPDAFSMKEHLTPRQAGKLASMLNAGKLVLTHFYKPVERVDIVTEVAENYNGPVVLATDGLSFEI